MKKILNLLNELDKLTGHIWRIELCEDESGCFYDSEDSNEYNAVDFESLDEAKTLLELEIAKRTSKQPLKDQNQRLKEVVNELMEILEDFETNFYKRS